MKSLIVTGSLIKIFINNKLVKESQSVSYNIDYGQTAVYGIDSPWPQEILTGRCSVTGSIQGIKIRNSGGLQSYEAIGLVKDVTAAPYISIRIQDRSTGEDLIYIPKAKINKQSLQAAAKGVARLSFDFTGLMVLEPLDRA